MIKNTKDITLITLTLIIISTYVSIVFAQENYTWKKLTGKWIVTNSTLIQKRIPTIQWGYNELLNYNTLINFNKLEKISTFKFNYNIHRLSIKDETIVLIPFAARSPKANYYYDFYAFKLCGDDNGIHSTSLIRSRWKDKTKSFRTKYNYVIDELTSEPLKLAYDTMHTVKITMSPERLRLFVNGKKVISHRVKNESYDGHIGFSVRNAFLAVDDVVVRDRAGKVVLEDNFDSSSIYVRTVKGRIKRGK